MSDLSSSFTTRIRKEKKTEVVTSLLNGPGFKYLSSCPFKKLMFLPYFSKGKKPNEPKQKELPGCCNSR